MDWNTLANIAYSYIMVAMYDGVKRFKTGSSPALAAVWPITGIIESLLPVFGPAAQWFVSIDPQVVPLLQNIEALLNSLAAVIQAAIPPGTATPGTPVVPIPPGTTTATAAMATQAGPILEEIKQSMGKLALALQPTEQAVTKEPVTPVHGLK